MKISNIRKSFAHSEVGKESACYFAACQNILCSMKKIGEKTQIIKFAGILLMLIGFHSNVLHSYSFFSPIIRQERLNVVSENQIFQLLSKPVINSEKVFQDTLLLQKNHDYQIEYQTSTITFFQPFGNVIVEYHFYPEKLAQRFYLFQEQEYSEDKELKIPKRQQPVFSNEANLKISGSKTISISVANNADFSLDQSLFLKIDGELSDNLNIEAQLSDSQSSITPEGDSREISSLDKVFLRLFSRQYEIAFGDLEMDFQNTRFINFSPRFEGLRAAWFGKNRFEGAITISKGKNITIQFNGKEAKQGPYYIFAQGNQAVQVVPGSEEVFLNGSRLQRGDDYSIDYAESSITFANRHFISASSYIQISFQYADENYKQNMYLASSDVKISEFLHLRNYIVIRNDDRDNPLQADFTDNDLEILRNSGDGIVWGSGVQEADDGLYILSDTGYYVYVGNDTTQTGNYNIHFAFVGSFNGDYEYISSGDYYEFAGYGQGSYLPIRQLTPPEFKANYDMILAYERETWLCKAEGIISDYDRNTFSGLDDNDNTGYAADLGFEFFPAYDRLLPRLWLGYRSIGKNLHTFADFSDPADNFNAIQIPDSLASSTYTGTLSFRLLNFYEPDIRFRRSQIRGFAQQDYLVFVSRFHQRKFFPGLIHHFSSFRRQYDSGWQDDFLHHDLKSAYKHGIFNFKFDHYNRESQTQVSQESDNRHVLRNWNYAIETQDQKRINLNVFWHNQFENLTGHHPDSTYSLTNKEIITVGLNSILNLSDHYLKVAISHRIIADRITHKQSEYDLAEISSRHSLLRKALSLSSGYALKNVEFYPKIKEFQFVGGNLGSYDEDSLYVGFGAGDYDWKIVRIDYDNPQMSVQLNANLTMNFTPKMITKSYLRKFQSETSLQIAEHSTEKDKVRLYWLDPAVLGNKNTTLYGRRFVQQTVWYNLVENRLSTRFRFKQEEILDNRYNNETDRTSNQTREGLLRLTSLPKTNFELLYENSLREESVYQSQNELNSCRLDIRNQMNPDLLLNTSLLYASERGERADNTNNYQLDSWEIGETLTYYLQKKYRLFARVSFKRNYRDGSAFLSFLADKKEGNIIKWNLNLNYRVNNFTSARLEYSGNSYPGQKEEHKLSAEIKAEF